MSDQQTADANGASRVVHDYIAGSGALDAVALRRCFAEGAALHGYLGNDVITGSADIYLADVARMASANVDMSSYKAEITAFTAVGNIACATVSMSGFAGTAFTDMLHLMRCGGEWRIVSKTFTTLPAPDADAAAGKAGSPGS